MTCRSFLLPGNILRGVSINAMKYRCGGLSAFLGFWWRTRSLGGPSWSWFVYQISITFEDIFRGDVGAMRE